MLGNGLVLKHEKPVDIYIDKLTNTIENIGTGEVFDTAITELSSKYSKQIISKERQFDWQKELKDKTKTVFKLTTIKTRTIIKGIISIEDKQDHIFMHLIERSTFNIGKTKSIKAKSRKKTTRKKPKATA